MESGSCDICNRSIKDMELDHEDGGSSHELSGYQCSWCNFEEKRAADRYFTGRSTEKAPTGYDWDGRQINRASTTF